MDSLPVRDAMRVMRQVIIPFIWIALTIGVSDKLTHHLTEKLAFEKTAHILSS